MISAIGEKKKKISQGTGHAGAAEVSFRVRDQASLTKEGDTWTGIGRDKRVSLPHMEEHPRENSQCRGPEAKWRAEERVPEM